MTFTATATVVQVIPAEHSVDGNSMVIATAAEVQSNTEGAVVELQLHLRVAGDTGFVVGDQVHVSGHATPGAQPTAVDAAQEAQDVADAAQEAEVAAAADEDVEGTAEPAE